MVRTLENNYFLVPAILGYLRELFRNHCFKLLKTPFEVVHYLEKL